MTRTEVRLQECIRESEEGISGRFAREHPVRFLIVRLAASFGWLNRVDDRLLAQFMLGSRALALRLGLILSQLLSPFALARTRCNDPVVGSILASWRYGVSGIPLGMRWNYERHVSVCAHCRSRSKFYRALYVTLGVLTLLAMLFFLFALTALQDVKPVEHVAFDILGLNISDMEHMLLWGVVAGLISSAITFALIVSTPTPIILSDLERDRDRHPKECHPEVIRSERSS
jgi:hypothetical protein